MLGRSVVNPTGWTIDMVHTALNMLKVRYPELAGVLMYGHGPRSGFSNATNHSTMQTDNATFNLIRNANLVLRELYPDD